MTTGMSDPFSTPPRPGAPPMLVRGPTHPAPAQGTLVRGPTCPPPAQGTLVKSFHKRIQELERIIEECHRSQLDGERAADMLRVANVRLKAEVTGFKQANKELRHKNEQLQQQLSEHTKEMDRKTPCTRTQCLDLQSDVKSAGAVIVQLSEKSSKLQEQLKQQETEAVNLRREMGKLLHEQQKPRQQQPLRLLRASTCGHFTNETDRHDMGGSMDMIKQECQRLRSRSELLELEVQAKDRRCMFAEMESTMLREELEAVHRSASHLGPKNRKDGADLNMTI